MRVRAVAAPSHESNAVGSIELECTPYGINMLYLGVGAYSAGYAPAALTSGTQVFAPWDCVEDVRVHADHVFLAVASALSPHNRLWLTHFSDGTVVRGAGLPAELKKRRMLIRAFAVLLMVSVAVSLTLQLPSWSRDIGQLGALVIGCGGAFVVFLLALLAEFLFIPRPLSSGDSQRLFVADLAHYRPEPVREGPPSPVPMERVELGELVRVLPRTGMATVIVLTASTLAAILTTTWITRGPSESPHAAAARNVPEPPQPLPAAAPVEVLPQPEEPPVEAAPAVSATAPVAAAPAAGEACTCGRSDSTLYQVGFPRLTTLLIGESTRRHKDHVHLEIELGVVNNGNETLKEVNLLVQFYEDEGKKPMKSRPLHYPARLSPGQAIKWHVEARGTSFVVHNPVRDMVDPEKEELASADDFADLLKANHRPVRLHGAMMLAYQGDPRAKAGALKLREALRENEAPYLDRVIAALGDMSTCDWRVSETGRVRQVQACVFNRSGKRQSALAMKLRALDRVFDHRSPLAEPPLVVAEKVWKLEDSYEPNEGRRAQISFDTDNPDGKVPEAFELFVDREELLF